MVYKLQVVAVVVVVDCRRWTKRAAIKQKTLGENRAVPLDVFSAKQLVDINFASADDVWNMQTWTINEK